MRWPLAVGAVTLSIPAIALLGFGMTRDPGAIESPLPGRAAPTFTLPAFTSGAPTPWHPEAIPHIDTVRLASYRGEVVVLNFWASWCLACRDEHRSLVEVGSRFVGTDVHFVGVLYNDRIGNALRWLEERGPVPYPSVQDPNARTAIDYGLYGVPETFFIGRDGRVAYKHIGPVNDSLLMARIAELRGRPMAASVP
jgi:cytochrome c biogenesis protein CcmG/thiol:disulfide interchange protein DsbE